MPVGQAKPSSPYPPAIDVFETVGEMHEGFGGTPPNEKSLQTPKPDMFSVALKRGYPFAQFVRTSAPVEDVPGVGMPVPMFVPPAPPPAVATRSGPLNVVG